jgi:hypothetical protein
MRHLEIVMVLIKQEKNFHFQLRNGKNQAGVLGLIGCFGGQIESTDKNPKAAACREIAEESTLVVKEADLSLAGEVKVDAKEGELVTMNKQDIYRNINKFTPATRAYFEQIHKEAYGTRSY